MVRAEKDKIIIELESTGINGAEDLQALQMAIIEAVKFHNYSDFPEPNFIYPLLSLLESTLPTFEQQKAIFQSQIDEHEKATSTESPDFETTLKFQDFETLLNMPLTESEKVRMFAKINELANLYPPTALTPTRTQRSMCIEFLRGNKHITSETFQKAILNKTA